MNCPCQLNGITCDGIHCEINAVVDKMNFKHKQYKIDYDSRRIAHGKPPLTPE
jgi:hypothetical protein